MKSYESVFMVAAAVAVMASPALAAGKQKVTKVDAPTLTCAPATPQAIDVTVAAGPLTGAPAGFSLQWMPAASYDPSTGWPAAWQTTNPDGSVTTSYCKASFSGNASGWIYNLGRDAVVTVTIGEPLFDNGASYSGPGCGEALACGTEYVFRGFAHATSTLYRSDFTPGAPSFALYCSTAPCNHADLGCTYTQGYWKTHGPIPTGNNSNEWDVTALTLGTVSYTDLEILSILNRPAAGNGLVSLAHQLIAAKLNVASGADDSAIVGAIAAADTLIGGLVVPPVGSGFLPPSATSALNSTLTQFNEGLIGPGHCN
ncbi:MAG TPA: hypothetical protein VFM29_04435 [Vicinamibacteria bacterium]|nr:hypothetical protein [Vicinamibacteria bacterium]